MKYQYMFDMFEIEHLSKHKEIFIMPLNERQSEILEELKKEKRMSVKKIAAFCYVSEMTVRRDLKKMESEGCLKRYNGGAVFLQSESMLPIYLRKLLHAKQKAKLSGLLKISYNKQF